MNFTAATTSAGQLVDFLAAQATITANKAETGGRDLLFSFLGIDWSAPTWDHVILLFCLISVVLYGFVLGRDRVVAILISTYISLAVTTNLPYMENISNYINQGNPTAFQISSFLVIFILVFLLLTRGSIIQRLSSLAGSWWQILIFAILQVGLLTSIIISFLPIDSQNHFSPLVISLFLSDLGFFLWLTLPIVALAVFKAKKKSFDED